jgi:hypothetical protein
MQEIIAIDDLSKEELIRVVENLQQQIFYLLRANEMAHADVVGLRATNQQLGELLAKRIVGILTQEHTIAPFVRDPKPEAPKEAPEEPETEEPTNETGPKPWMKDEFNA